MSNVHLSAFETTSSTQIILIRSLWTAYANALNTLKSAFPVSELKKAPSVEYLLEEDAITLGFKPIHNDFTRRRYCRAGAGGLKPRQNRQGLSEKQLDDENVSRIRDFLTDGAYLVQLACSGVSRALWGLAKADVVSRLFQSLFDLNIPHSNALKNVQRAWLLERSRTLTRLYSLRHPALRTRPAPRIVLTHRLEI